MRAKSEREQKIAGGKESVLAAAIAKTKAETTREEKINKQ